MKVEYLYEGEPLWGKGKVEILLTAENNEDKKFIKFFKMLMEDVNEYHEIAIDNEDKDIAIMV